MKLTKDEARILSEALRAGKYDLLESGTQFDPNTTVKALTKLEERLAIAGRDERRFGRKSMNDFHNCINRFVSKELGHDN
jgi:hypothetical protein